MQKKDHKHQFVMLKTFIVLLKALGWFVLVGGLAAAIEAMIMPQIFDRFGLLNIYNSTWLLALAILIGAVLYTMIFFALAEAVGAFLSLEKNMRKMHELLDKK
ncbi:hypothetical protein KJ836_00905 [Patescibacteria group bacterium]|nr:hypothetical protein [Patescibacteria group bacterium]